MTIPNNPSLNEQWTNDVTGVTYVWDGNRWIIVSNNDDILEGYLPLTGGKLTGRLSIAKVREDKNSIALSIAGRVRNGDGDVIDDVLFKSYQRIEGNSQPDYISYYGSTGGANEILNRTTAQDEFADKQIVSDALEVQSVIEDQQSVQDNQINALETQLQLLAQTQAVGKWTYNRNISGGSVRPPSSASFYATHKDGAENVLLNWADARLFMISKTDIDGKQFVFTEFEEGDKMEVLATDGSSACYGTVTNQPTQEAYGNLILAVERSNGGPSEGKEYLLSVYRPGSNGGTVDLDVLDERYLIKTGDTMTGQLKLEQTQLTTVKADGTQQYKINPNGGDYFTNIYSFNAANQAGGMRLRVAPGDTSDGYKTFLQSTFKENTINGTNHGVETQLNWLKTPTADHHATNKFYVDSNFLSTKGEQVLDAQKWQLKQKVGDEEKLMMEVHNDKNFIYKLNYPTAADHAASKEYVDDVEERLTEQIEQIDSPIVPGNSPLRPPGLRFSYTDGSSVSDGKFAWYDNGGRRLRISATSHDFPWGTSSPVGDIVYSEAHLFHIYATTTSNGQDKWRIKTTGSFNRMDWHANDILLYVPYHLTNGSFSTNAAYYITISGLF